MLSQNATVGLTACCVIFLLQKQNRENEKRTTVRGQTLTSVKSRSKDDNDDDDCDDVAAAIGRFSFVNVGEDVCVCACLCECVKHKNKHNVTMQKANKQNCCILMGGRYVCLCVCL